MAPSGLVHLPLELLALVISFLPNRDVKSLRLACRALHAAVKLRLHRVFLSANPRDVQVFRAIADHETFRKAIVEIIWDDAVIRDLGMGPGYHEAFHARYDEERVAEEVPNVPSWFSRARRDNNFQLGARYQYDPLDRPERAIAAQLPVQESWAYFQRWHRQQQDAIARGDDEAALRYGLTRFPALRTITITPATHGFNLTFPLYDTPTIRSLPPGLNYPVPRGWPTIGEGEPVVNMPPWADEDAILMQGDERELWDKWRGVRIVLRELARHADAHPDHPVAVAELILDAHHLDTGLNGRFFEQPSPTYHRLVSLLRRPGFRRLDLALAVGGQEFRGWSAFRNTFLKRALSEIGPGLEHLSLTTDLFDDVKPWTLVQPAGGPMAHHIPLLRTVFPVDRWPNLRHFGLAGFLVTREDLLELLAALPATLRSLQLGNITFLDEGGSWRALLEDMRDRLGWRDRPARERPRVVIYLLEIDGQRRPGRALWVDAEAVSRFLYEDGPNPFGREDGRDPNQILFSRAGTVRDAFDPEYERPWVELLELWKLGYIKLEPGSERWLM